MTTTLEPVAPARNLSLTSARALAALVGCLQSAGIVYFLVIDPGASVWHGPWVDVPVIAALVTAVGLKLATGLVPGLAAGARIRLGIAAVTLGIAVTLVKAPLYDEPEGLTIVVADLVLLALLLLARRTEERAGGR